MNAHNAIVDFSAVAVPLAGNADGVFAALGRPRLVDATDGLGMGMVFGNDLLTAISEFLFIPFDRFEKALQCSWRSPELQGDRLGCLAMQIRKLTLDINLQQPPCIASAKTIGKQHEKRIELPSQGRNVL